MSFIDLTHAAQRLLWKKKHRGLSKMELNPGFLVFVLGNWIMASCAIYLAYRRGVKKGLESGGELFELTNDMILFIEKKNYHEALLKAVSIRKLFPQMETFEERLKNMRQEAPEIETD